MKTWPWILAGAFTGMLFGVLAVDLASRYQDPVHNSGKAVYIKSTQTCVVETENQTALEFRELMTWCRTQQLFNDYEQAHK
jgi:hypothetical protein